MYQRDGVVGGEEQLAGIVYTQTVDVVVERGVVLNEPLAEIRAVGADGEGEVGKRELGIAVEQLCLALAAECPGNVYALTDGVER